MNLIFFALISLENNNVQQQNLLFILRKKVEEVSYPLGEDDHYTDVSKDILNLHVILNDDASTDSDGDVEEF